MQWERLGIGFDLEQISLLSILVLRIEVKTCPVVLIQILAQMGEANPEYLKPKDKKIASFKLVVI